MNPQELPHLGAAMLIGQLSHHIEWLMDGDRALELQDPISPNVLDGDWKPLVREVRSLLDGYGGRYGIHGPFLNVPLVCIDPKIQSVVDERMRKGIDFANEVGATHMVVHSPFDFFGGPFVPHSVGFGLQREIDLAHKTLDPILTLAQKAGCTLVIETIRDKNTTPLLTLVRSFNSPYVRMSLDTGHAFIAHHMGGPTPDQWVVEAGELLGHVHLVDNDGQYDRHWRPGRGNINWYAVFEALKKTNANPRLILELRDVEELPLAAQWLMEQGLAR